MRSMFEKMSQYALLRAAVYLALGILLIFMPNTVTNIIVYIIAGYVAFMGILAVISSLRNSKNTNAFGFEFVSGVLLIVLAIVLLIFSKQIVSILPIFFGIMVILSGAAYFVQAFSAKKAGIANFALLIILGIVFVAAGLFMVFKPFLTVILALQIFGGIVAALGISEIITFFMFGTKTKTQDK